MTLWLLADARAKKFMVDFYIIWFNSVGFEDPTVALRAVKRSWSGRAESYCADPVSTSILRPTPVMVSVR